MSTPPQPTCSKISTPTSHRGGTRLAFAELKDAVQHKIETYENFALSDDRFYPTIRTAVEAYAAEHHLTWQPGPSPYHLD